MSNSITMLVNQRGTQIKDIRRATLNQDQKSERYLISPIGTPRLRLGRSIILMLASLVILLPDLSIHKIEDFLHNQVET